MEDVLMEGRHWAELRNPEELMRSLREESQLYQDIVGLGAHGDNVYVSSLQRAAVMIGSIKG